VNPEAEYNLHDNYTLPFPEIPEGYDAVMKFTADHDIMLNAYVSDGANGKVALYREDFAGRPGPMADNNYTMRPFNPNGGGAPVAPTAIDFETGNFSQFSNFTNDATYPWYISADAAYTGSYGMMSGNAGVAESASTFTATVNYTTDGTISFDYAAWGEGTYIAWDRCIFQIDGEEMFREGATQLWNNYSTEVAAGQHTFSWIYEKDGSLDPMGDYFAVDNIVFEGGRMVGNRDVATSFEGSFGGWTTIDADGDGFNWELASYEFYGYMIPAHSGEDCVTSASYDGYDMVGLYPDNYLVSPQIQLGGSITFYACAQDPDYAAEHFGVAVSTTNNTNASAFTTVGEWTISAKSTGNGSGNYKTRSRSGRETTWVPYTVDLSAYSGQGYVAIRHFGCSDQFYLNIDDVTIVEGVAPTPDDPTPDDPTPDDPTPVDPDTPVIPTPASFSAGPVIENLNVLKGTYYLVASSTDPDFQVTIGFEELPCPIAAVTNIYPADNAWGISPENLILRWKLNDYANEWRLVFSSTYWPEDEIDTEHPATYVTPWSSNLQESFNISAALEANGYHLWNNTNYFWRIEQRSNPGTEWECYTPGPVFGFTTTLNVPQHLTASNTRIFEYEETVTLSWDPIVDRNNDRTYRRYRIYMDGERIHDTPDNVVTTSWDIPQNLLTYNMYNEHGYVFEVTAVYDEGESPKSNAVEIWVSGKGSVSGTAYEQDGVTPIGGVTVTIQGFNEFGNVETYTFLTDENGYYEGAVHAGTYPIAVAQKEGYQDAVTIHPLPLHIVYQELTDHVDFIMDEVFYAPAHVCAEPTYVPGVEGDTLPKIWWDFDFFTELRENFEDWDNTPFEWQNDATYPWTLTTDAHEGTYALKSGNAGVHSTTSTLQVAVEIPQDGMFSFDFWSRGESTTDTYDWDVSRFYLDGQQMFQYGQHSGWETFSLPITAGTHTFKWEYKKDSSVHPSAGDCFMIDNIVFVGLPEDIENSRALHHFNIYRTDCYNDGPYNDENTTFLATVWRPDVSYFDVSWPEAPVGVYKYGVSAVYSGNQADNPNNPRVDYPFEDRESEIVWHTMCSPCIDKDMYLYDEVTINVVMNSADSPEGTKVTFTNTNPGEQYNHPMEPIILGETGFYRFPSFRKGNYNILIEHAGFETILDYQEIWTARDLRYVMIEIIYNPINLYVSRTGWAMWEPFIPDGPGAPVTPDTPDTPAGELFNVSFEGLSDNELPAGWTSIDADGDGNDWYTLEVSTIPGHAGSLGLATSASYNGEVLYPDNYLVSPQVALGGTLTFYACAQDASWAAEHFGVAVSTTNNTSASAFTTIQEWTLSAKSVGARTSDTRSDNRDQGNWYEFNVDLSAYAGQTGYVAIRHFNCSDMFRMNVDDLVLTGSGSRAERHLEGYKIMCTTIDGEPIFNHNTPVEQPFCQLATVDPYSGQQLLIEGNYYICKVAAIYSTGMSDYISCTWQYEPCEHWAGTLNGVTAEGNTITWDYPGGDVPGPIDPPQPGNDVTVVLNVPGDIWGDGTGYQLLLDADHNTYGSTIPASGNFTAGTFADFEYTIPENAVCDTYTNTIVINGSQSITIPAGVYDYVFLNPYPGGTYYIASDNGNFPGRGDDYEFLAGKTYTFTLSVNNYDNITLVITDNGRSEGVACNTPAVSDNSQCRRAENVADATILAKTMDVNTTSFDNRDGWIYYDNGVASSTVLGLANQGTGEIFPFSFGVMFPAGSYQGNTLTKAAYYDPAPNTGTVEIFQGGTTGPTTMIYSQPYSTTGAEDFVEFTFTTPVTIDPAQSLWVVMHTDGGYVAALDTQSGNANGMWLYSELLSDDWQTVYQATGGAYNGNWMIRAYVEEGTTPPTPPTPAEGILGAMIFVDGEWEAFVEAPTNTYTYEGDGQEICVRIVYDGAAELPANNYYYAMSCEECIGGIEPQPACEPGAPLFAEVNGETDQVHLYWAEQPEPPTPGEYSSFSESFENGMPAGWTTIDADGDGFNWDLGSVVMAGYSIPSHSGEDCITSQSYDFGAGALYPDNYLVSPQVTLGGTISFWACAQDASYAAEHFGFAVSTTGTNASDFNTIQEWTMTAKSLGNAGNYLTRSRNDREGTWYQYIIDLSDYAGMTGYVAIRHFNCSDMFYLDVDDIEMNVRSMGDRDGEIVAYNIYRSEDGAEYELIATVDGNVTEYFDAPGAGTYYYQVTAVYADGCESAPAASGIDPTVNYVVVGVTGIGENETNIGENEANVNLFPNPTKGNVTIQAKGMSRITVVSVLGQVVFDTELDQDEYIMNMAQFNTGLYMVRVYTNEGVTVKRVTVMH
jgi:hypothetical protein